MFVRLDDQEERRIAYIEQVLDHVEAQLKGNQTKNDSGTAANQGSYSDE
jgi:hypothetical protein